MLSESQSQRSRKKFTHCINSPKLRRHRKLKELPTSYFATSNIQPFTKITNKVSVTLK